MKTVMGRTKWYSTVIGKMLSNEKYMGAALLQKTYTVDYLTKQRAKNNGELTKYFIKNNHPPIVSEEMFYGVQTEKLRRSCFRQYAGHSSRYPITTKLICGCCGNHFLRVIRKRGEKEHIVWRCKSRILYGSRYCTKLYTIPETDLHKAIWRAYSSVLHMKRCSDCLELKEIANQMAERKKTIFRAIQENVQGFCAWNDLTAYYAKVKNECDELSERLLRKFLEGEESIFIRCSFKYMKPYSHYKKYEDELQKFLLELGRGFSFVASQKRITFDGRIGIVLCADKSESVVKYTLPENEAQIFASKYKLYLPSEEELLRELNQEYQALEAGKSEENVGGRED